MQYKKAPAYYIYKVLPKCPIAFMQVL